MAKKLEFYEGEEAAKRFDDLARAVFTPVSKPLERPKEFAEADTKAIGQDLNRS